MIKKAAILVISDRAYRGERKDRSGEAVEDVLKKNGFEVVEKRIVPDEKEKIKEVLKEWADIKAIPLIITTGGTGLSPRDVTPQATKEILDYEVPGIAEIMRIKSFEITPNAILSRAVSGVRKGSLIINLPGSPSGAKENLSFIIPAIDHALLKISGDESECVT